MLREKEIKSSSYILDILRNISHTKRLQATILLSADIFEKGYLSYDRKKRFFVFRSDVLSEQYIPGQKINISYLLRETIFEFESTILSVQTTFLTLTVPKIFKSSFKREYSRYFPKLNEEIHIILDDGTTCEVKNINTSGVSFYNNNIGLKIEDSIRNICIVFSGNSVCVDTKIKYIISTDTDKLLYGAEFESIDWFSNYALYNYIVKKTYPKVKEITDFSKETIYQLYDESGYFDLKSRKEIEVSFNNMFDLMNKIKIYPQIISNPAFYHNNQIYMGASVLRIYNNTFLAQHLAAIPQARLFSTSKASIYLSINDYLLCNPHFKYYLTYFDATNKWHNKMYQNIGGFIEDDTKFLYDTLDYFECYFEHYGQNNISTYQSQILTNPIEFIKYANNNLPKLYNQTHGYNIDNFKLSEVKQLYEMAGIYTQRQLIKITNNNNLIAYGIIEVYSEGLNLYNVLDMLRLYIVDRNCDMNEVFISAINECKYFFDKYKKKKFNIFVKLTKDARKSINIPGVNYDFLVGTVMANRIGSVEYKNLFLNMTR